MCSSPNHMYVLHWENKLKSYAKHIGLEDKEFIEKQINSWKKAFDPKCKDAKKGAKDFATYSEFIQHLKKNDPEGLKYISIGEGKY